MPKGMFVVMIHGENTKSPGVYWMSSMTRHHTVYGTKDLFHAEISSRIAHWYMEVRIPQMLRHFGLKVTVDNCLICWNGGIRAAIRHHLTAITKRYLREYHRLEG